MTTNEETEFDKWWREQGCREECSTHEERALQAWDAAYKNKLIQIMTTPILQS